VAWRVSLQDLFAYYLCFKCRKPYFGGERVCGEGGGAFDPTELVCGGCSPWSGEIDCPKHGKDFIEFKCRFCCSVAVCAEGYRVGSYLTCWPVYHVLACAAVPFLTLYAARVRLPCA
jgi:hypothetical protein